MQDDDVRSLKEIDETVRTIAPRIIPRDVLEIAAEERLVKLALEFVRLNEAPNALSVLIGATQLHDHAQLAKLLRRCARVIELMRDDNQLDCHLAAAEAAKRIEALLIADEVAK